MNDEILRIYPTNLGRYNEGELMGGWLALPAEEDEIRDFLRDTVGIELDPERAHMRAMNGERVYEEWFITDWESDYWDRIGEYANIWALNEEAQRIEDMNGYERKTMRAALEVFGDEVHRMDVDDLVLLEDVNTEYDLGYYWAIDSGCYQIDDKEPLARYFDYEAFGRDIAIESNGGFTSYGYVEYR